MILKKEMDIAYNNSLDKDHTAFVLDTCRYYYADTSVALKELKEPYHGCYK